LFLRNKRGTILFYREDVFSNEGEELREMDRILFFENKYRAVDPCLGLQEESQEIRGIVGVRKYIEQSRKYSQMHDAENFVPTSRVDVTKIN
jgi:hypothetical protein